MSYDHFYVYREGSKKMKQNFLKIPINRIIALILLDIMSIVVASFAALYIRFDFSFEGIPQEYLIKFENIIVYNIIHYSSSHYGSCIKVYGAMPVRRSC